MIPASPPADVPISATAIDIGACMPSFPRFLPHTLGLTLLLALAAPTERAVAASDASAFVTELGSDALKAMKDQSLTPTDRVKHFGALVRKDFDLPRIARFVLGRYWRDASESERAEFTDRFGDYMVKLYSQRFAGYNGEVFRVVKERVESQTTTLVATEITRSTTGEPVAVGWRVAKTPDGYKITDIDVAGVSLALAQRDEIASAIQQNGGALPALLKQLQKKTDELELSAK
jgi:phospholipid transport system substrate-binding protein